MTKSLQEELELLKANYELVNDQDPFEGPVWEFSFLQDGPGKLGHFLQFLRRLESDIIYTGIYLSEFELLGFDRNQWVDESRGLDFPFDAGKFNPGATLAEILRFIIDLDHIFRHELGSSPSTNYALKLVKQKAGRPIDCRSLKRLKFLEKAYRLIKSRTDNKGNRRDKDWQIIENVAKLFGVSETQVRIAIGRVPSGRE